MLLTCTIPGGVTLGWRYNSDNGLIGNGVYQPANNIVPPTNPDTVRGVVFTHSLLDSSPDLVSQLSFTASDDMNGGVIRCVGDAATSTDGVESVSDDIIVQVEQFCKLHTYKAKQFLNIA